jgi:hypothetical protein
MIKKSIISPIHKAVRSYVKRYQLEGVREDELLDED